MMTVKTPTSVKDGIHVCESEMAVSVKIVMGLMLASALKDIFLLRTVASI